MDILQQKSKINQVKWLNHFYIYKEKWKRQREILITSFFILRRYSRRDGYSPAELKNKSSEMVEPFPHLQGEMKKIERDIDSLFFLSQGGIQGEMDILQQKSKINQVKWLNHFSIYKEKWKRQRDILITYFFIPRRYSRRDGYSPAELKNKLSEMVEPFHR